MVSSIVKVWTMVDDGIDDIDDGIVNIDHIDNGIDDSIVNCKTTILT